MSTMEFSGAAYRGDASSALDKGETFESWADDYYSSPAALKHYDRAIGRMLEALGQTPGCPVLDAGCGTGVHSVRVAKAGFAAHAIDISAVALAGARRNAERAGVADRITFGRGDLTRLCFDDGQFETLFSWGVLTHIPDLELALAELARVLRPGGRMAIQVTNSTAWDYKVERLARRVLGRPLAGQERRRFGVGGWCRMHGGRLYNWQNDVAEVTRTLGTLGLTPVARLGSEFTELHRRVPNPLRWALRRANEAWFAMNLPAAPAVTNILVFRKG